MHSSRSRFATINVTRCILELETDVTKTSPAGRSHDENPQFGVLRCSREKIRFWLVNHSLQLHVAQPYVFTVFLCFYSLLQSGTILRTKSRALAICLNHQSPLAVAANPKLPGMYQGHALLLGLHLGASGSSAVLSGSP